MGIPESAYWLATLGSANLKRAAAKQILYRWCIGQGKPASTLAEMTAEDTAALGLEQIQLEALRASLPQATGHAAALARLAAQGIQVLTRDDSAYPEALPQRLDEERLPYILYYNGNLELLCQPGIAVAGSGQPSGAAVAFARSLAQELAAVECVLLSGYHKGIERLTAEAMLESGGSVIIVLPLGLCANARLLADLNALLRSGRLLVLSPATCDAPYSDALAAARLPLIAAMSELLLAIEPEQQPDGWLQALRPPLPATAFWQGAGAPTAREWQTQGAALVNSAEQALTIWQDIRDGAGYAPKQDESAAFTYDPAPITFSDADSAIAILSQSGTVPDVLARRLRERAPKWGN